MATAPAPQGLPLLYNDIVPLSSVDHANYKSKPLDAAPFLRTINAIPLTVEEFPLAQRHYPIVFSGHDDPVPLALMGVNEGINVFIDEDGKLREPNTYVPAYIRRYPYMLARLNPDSTELSLCFDPTAGAIGEFEDGEPLFENGQPSKLTNDILQFAQQFEEGGIRTNEFVKELVELELLMDGEVTIQPEGGPQPFIYRGFKMVNEEKLANLRGDQLRKAHKSGLLQLVYAHLFSLSLMRDIFVRQVQLGLQPNIELALPQTGQTA